MNVALKKPPYLLVELANCHGGSEEVLFNTISAYGELEYLRKGIKFQVLEPSSISLPDFEWYKVYEKLYFSIDVWQKAINIASSKGDVWLDIFDLYGVEVLKCNLGQIMGIKLQASILENYEIYYALEKLDLSSKLLIINVSGFDLDRITTTCSRLRVISQHLILQIGFQSYPTAIEDTALNKIAALKVAFSGFHLGIADHADATSDFAQLVPIYANLMGCEYIEKHFTVARDAAEYDKFSALEPKQMQNLCRRLNDISTALTDDFISSSEKEYLQKTVQIPVTASSVPAGSLLSLEDIKFRRTSQEGISWQQVLDHQISKEILGSNLSLNETVKAKHFRKVKVAVIVAGRMKSTRLVKKALLPIGNMTSVERCLMQCIAMQNVEEVILATSELKEDAVLAGYLLEGQAKLWLGDPDDVIDRYLGACEHYAIDVVVRVTADCPFILPEILDHLLDSHFATGADYTVADDFAVGTSGEIINVNALRKVQDYFGRAEYSEYMTWYFQNNPECFKINRVDLPKDLIRGCRVTLDYQEDMEMFQEIIKYCQNPNRPISATELFSILDDHPEIVKINSHIQLKYKTDQDLIDKLNKATRMSFENKRGFQS